jgi:hypothetical protein
LFLMFRFVSLFLMPPVKMGGTLIELKPVPIFDLTTGQIAGPAKSKAEARKIAINGQQALIGKLGEKAPNWRLGIAEHRHFFDVRFRFRKDDGG